MLLEQKWRYMKARCGRSKAYIDCTICDEWVNNFRAFEKWALENLYNCKGEELELDKDLFSNGRKIYSPETCCFLPKSINTLISYKKEKESGLPTGVSMADNGKFVAMIHRYEGHLTKTFDTAEQASTFYRENKERHIRELAEFYKDYLPERIYVALLQYKVV